MSAIQVMISDMPELLRSMVTGILDADSNFMLVDTDCHAGGYERPDNLVLLVARDAMNELLPFALGTPVIPALGVVAIADNGVDATVVRITTNALKLENAASGSLSDAIRVAAGARNH